MVSLFRATREWGEVGAGVKTFMVGAVFILLLWALVCRRRGYLVWASSRRCWPVRDRDPLVSSPFLSPKVLTTLRLLHGLWCLYVIKWTIDNPGPIAREAGVFALYTAWNYAIFAALSLGLGLYGLTMAHVPRAATPGPAKPACSAVNSFETAKDVVRGLLWTMYQQQLPAALLVSLVFWCFIYPRVQPGVRQGLEHLGSANQHLWNAAYMLCELALNEVPVHMAHALSMLGVATGYLYFCILCFGAVPSMPFLDIATPQAAGVFVGMCLVHLLVYVLAWWVSAHKMRWLQARQLPQLAGDGPCDKAWHRQKPRRPRAEEEQQGTELAGAADSQTAGLQKRHTAGPRSRTRA